MPDREKVIKALERAKAQSDEYAQDHIIVPFKELDMILALLREQETEYKPDGPDFIDGRMYTRWKCTSCQYFVCTEKGTPDMKYCPKCGRRVKWDD